MAKILCVDADRHFGNFVCAHLRDAGHACVLESRGAHALTIAQENMVDMIVAEVMLPDVCGFEICRRVRAHRDLFTVPVILMSSMASEDEVEHGLAQGADDYLAKPFEPQLLIGRVNEHLRENNAALQPDPNTMLSSAKMIKAVIQRLITQKIPFATAYIEMENIITFGKNAGVDHRDKALRHVARIITRYGRHLQSPLFHPAHMGHGHFVCVMETEHIVPYCERICASWESHLPEFYELIGVKMPRKGSGVNLGPKGIPLLELNVCVTDSEASGARSVKEYFDVLTQLRNKAQNDGGAGLHIDNRRSFGRTRVAS